ncbi:MULTISPECIES: RidA family protein [unclassified Variovorax]|uniref:RidA family protein n=1 Tax=unclassified Variovorax TaxID=663243 RepID=UPI0008394B23|nr:MULTISPECIES: RidA family protein [unclassified Variovorax]PNG52938.1 2-iminobutanoate/2-iminopropanoate deaminase [Variovorax sp. B2]PNG53510.1 2-iminobutanoate/2-iminopropanoate deaminase [Variovorax sp. B4]VTV10930.1 Enamine/imine deaminase [Variovorax sp. WDL1]
MAGENGAQPERTSGLVHVAVPALAKPGGHYSHAALGGGMVFIAGQLPITPGGERLIDADFDEQVVQTLANVQAALLAAGSGIDKLLQVRVYLDDIANWRAFDLLYERWAGRSRPARAIVPTGPLHFGFKVEMEATALA